MVVVVLRSDGEVMVKWSLVVSLATPRTLEGPKYCRLLKRNTNILVTVLRPQWRPPMRGRVNFDHFLRRMLFWREQSLLQKVVA